MNRENSILPGSKNTVFAGAGPGEGSNKGKYLPGLFRLNPGASQWEIVSNGLPKNVAIRCIAQNPNHPKTLFVGTDDGPYRSTDGGVSWQRPNFPDLNTVIWSIAIHPIHPEIIYCGAAPVAIYRSIDGGENWRRITAIQSPSHCERDGFDTRTISITFNPTRTDEVYVGLEVSGALRSTDAGKTWSDVSSHLMELAQLSHLQSNVGGRDCGICEGMLDTHAMAISSAAPETAFIGLRMGIFRTQDGGTSWQEIGIGKYSPLTYCRDIIVSPHNPTIIYAALSEAAVSTAGALYRSEDLSRTWHRIDHGVNAKSTIMSLAIHPTDPNSLYCIARSGQMIGTIDNGTTWFDLPLPDDVGDAYSIACY